MYVKMNFNLIHLETLIPHQKLLEKYVSVTPKKQMRGQMRVFEYKLGIIFIISP